MNLRMKSSFRCQRVAIAAFTKGNDMKLRQRPGIPEYGEATPLHLSLWMNL